MTMRRFFQIHRIPLELTIIDRWAVIPENAVPDFHREKYLKRKTAVELYINTSMSISEITQQTGIGRQELHRHVLRCVQLDDSGQPWGYRALIPRKNINGYTRQQAPDSESQWAGAFRQLLDKYPQIQAAIDKEYLGKNKNKAMDSIITPKELHRKFISACKSAGITLLEYPFNTQYLAKRSLERYVRELELQRSSEAVSRYGDDASRQMFRTGRGDKNRSSIIPCYRTVQFDGHRVDGEFAIIFTTPDGTEHVEVLHRLWYLALLDVGSRSILGWHVSFNREYTSEDVLHTLQKAILPWTPRTFTTPELQYPDIGGFPGAIPETHWAVWSELMMDNGKANISHVVMNRLTSVVGCAVNLGPVSTPELRGILERTFRSIEEDGPHRFSNTTGGNPADPRRKDPSGHAIRFKITYEHLLDILEIATYVYNGMPHEGLFHLSPLDVIQQHVMREKNIRVLPEEKRMYVEDVLIEATRTVQGSLKKGKRPHIEFERAVYRNDVLSNSYSLVGKTLTLLFNPDDIRVLRAFLPDGSPIGNLIVTGKWARRPHSLELRRYINRLKYKRIIKFALNGDPFEALEKHLTENAVHSKSKRGKLAKLQQETDRWLAELQNNPDTNLDTDSVEDDDDGSGMQENQEEIDPDFESIQLSQQNLPQRNIRKTIIP